MVCFNNQYSIDVLMVIDMHALYSRFAISFIKSGDAAAIKSLLTTGTLLLNVFKGLSADTDDVCNTGRRWQSCNDYCR